jgi:hypothetical protein
VRCALQKLLDPWRDRVFNILAHSMTTAAALAVSFVLAPSTKRKRRAFVRPRDSLR